MEPQVYRNDGQGLFVRLSYSNAPLLEKLEVHYVDEKPSRAAANAKSADSHVDAPSRKHAARDAAKPIAIGDASAQLLGYEWLAAIATVRSNALLLPWQKVEPHLETGTRRELGYKGRH